MLVKCIILENYVEMYDCKSPQLVWNLIPLDDSVPPGWIVQTQSVCDEICAIREKWIQKAVEEEEEKVRKRKGKKK